MRKRESTSLICGIIIFAFCDWIGVPMATVTLEGIVENGRIRLNESVALPEHTKVFVVVPDLQQAHLRSPRLANSADADRFAKRLIQTPANAKL